MKPRIYPNRTTTYSSLLILVFLAMAICAFPLKGLGQACDKYVSDSTGADTGGCGTQVSPCASISYGVSVMSAGEVMCVAGGTYIENVTIPAAKSNITLLGGHDPSTWTRKVTVFHSVVDGGGPGNVFVVQADNITIDGFVIQNGNNGVYAYNSGVNVTLSNNIVRNNTWGVYFYDDNNKYMSHNLIIDNTRAGFFYPQTSGYLYSTNNTIANNTNSGFYFGALAGAAYIRNDVITDNTDDIVNFGMPITVEYSNVGEGWTGTGNISVDPRFWNASLPDHGLQPGSSCIDAGDPSGIYFDPDSSNNDIGFTGGPSWGYTMDSV